MKIFIKDIATIQTGLFSNRFTEGDIVYLQTKHFNEEGELKSNPIPDLAIKDVDQKHILEKGDVIFSAKGSRNFAAVYDCEYSCVASTSFFVIKLQNKNEILPQYLTWFLNHPNTLNKLKSQATGTSIPSIAKPVLLELEIPVPELKTQKQIIRISEMRKKEKQIIKQIDSLKEILIQQKISKALK